MAKCPVSSGPLRKELGRFGFIGSSTLLTASPRCLYSLAPRLRGEGGVRGSFGKFGDRRECGDYPPPPHPKRTPPPPPNGGGEGEDERARPKESRGNFRNPPPPRPPPPRRQTHTTRPRRLQPSA